MDQTRWGLFFENDVFGWILDTEEHQGHEWGSEVWDRCLLRWWSAFEQWSNAKRAGNALSAGAHDCTEYYADEMTREWRDQAKRRKVLRVFRKIDSSISEQMDRDRAIEKGYRYDTPSSSSGEDSASDLDESTDSSVKAEEDAAIKHLFSFNA